MVDSGDELGNVNREVDLVRIGADGSELNRSSLLRLGEANTLVSIQSDVDIADDGRTALIGFAAVSRTEWTYSVARLDLVTAVLGPLVPIATEKPPPIPAGAPSPTPAPEGQPSFPTSRMNVSGPAVRLAPDGRRAFVWSTEQVSTDDGTGPSRCVAGTCGWARPRTTSRSQPVAALATMAPYCSSADFAPPIASSRSARIGRRTAQSTRRVGRTRRLDRDGRISRAARSRMPSR